MTKKKSTGAREDAHADADRKDEARLRCVALAELYLILIDKGECEKAPMMRSLMKRIDEALADFGGDDGTLWETAKNRLQCAQEDKMAQRKQ